MFDYQIQSLCTILLFLSAYKTVSGVNGPLVILDDVKVKEDYSHELIAM